MRLPRQSTPPGYLRLFRLFHLAAAPASACSPMSGLPGVISGASTRKSRDSASRIASLGVVPCFLQYAASGAASEPRRKVMRSFIRFKL